MKTGILFFYFAFTLTLSGHFTRVYASLANSKGFVAPKFSENHRVDNNDQKLCNTNAAIGFKQAGKASFYGGYWDGRLTANGEIYDQDTLTAAHKTLPFNSKVLVRNLLNNKEVVVRINNRGPYVRGRIIDLSVAAAKRLEMRKSGIAPVEIVVIQ